MSDLNGLPLRYLVDLDDEHITFDENITVVGYNFNKPLPKRSLPVQLGSLFDISETGLYKPYVNGEIPDPQGPGFWKNLHDQLGRAQNRGFRLISWTGMDNAAFREFELKRAIDLSLVYKVGVLLLNPTLIPHGQDTTKLLAEHINTYGIIDLGTGASPVELNQLRCSVGKPDMPVWFVYNYLQGAEKAADEAKNYNNMGVTLADEVKYDSSFDVLIPQIKVQA